jgi:hypothetical protein
MTRKTTVQAFSEIYASTLTGLLSSANYQTLSAQPSEIVMLLDVADVVVLEAMKRYERWIHVQLGEFHEI